MEPKDEIKSKLNISDIISEYLALKPAGGGSFKAVCPFHSEKTPSFYVSTEKQIWHCFGCDKGGDVISFVMEIDGVDFLSALKTLGKKAGVEVDLKPEKFSGEKEMSYKINALACKFYQTILHEHQAGKKARDYMRSRGINETLANEFQLGAAPDSWDGLYGFLLKRGYGQTAIVAAGLAKSRQSGSGFVDRFRNRLMIPLCDASGRVLGFTGRLLEEQTEKTGPKYLNSPETVIYKKSDVLFGLHLAKKSIRNEKSVIIVEGNLDVIASHNAGVRHIVASSGTALTQSQLIILKRLTENILFCFDSDNAGFAAAQRGIRIALSLGFRVKVIAIPAELGKDPDDVVQKNPATWNALVARPINVLKYIFDKSIVDLSLSDIASKQRFVKIMLDELGFVSDMVEREHWLAQIADACRLDIAQLRGELGKTNRPAVNETEPKKTFFKAAAAAPSSKQAAAAAELIALILQFPSLAAEVVGELEEHHFPENWTAAVYKKIILLYTQAKLSSIAPEQLFTIIEDTGSKFTAEARSAILRAEERIQGMSQKTAREELRRHIDILHSLRTHLRKEELERDLRRAEGAGDNELAARLLHEYSKL